MTHHIYLFDRNENTIVLSEALDEKAIDILIGLVMGRLFPEQCEMWRSIKKNVGEKFKKEVTVRTEAARKDISSREGSLQSALRESVVDDVMKLFP